MCKEKYAKKLNSRIFPGSQGGPLEHVIAAKAVAFGEALKPDFNNYAQQVVANAKVLADALMDKGFKLVTDGTDNHLILMDLSDRGDLTGKEAERVLDDSGITVNKNTVPNEKRSPFVTSGVRIGTPALTTRGMKESEMQIIGGWIAEVLDNWQSTDTHKKVRDDVREMCKQFPVYP